MVLAFGINRFALKRSAFRDDYCLSCRKRRMSEQIRFFAVMHLFWIPLVPLGFWKRWHCNVCGEDPHRQVGPRRSMKMIGIIVLALIALAGWVTPPEGEIYTFIWGMRIVATVLFLLTVRSIRRHPKEPTLKQRLAELSPMDRTDCPFCGASLVVSPGGSVCSGCGIKAL